MSTIVVTSGLPGATLYCSKFFTTQPIVCSTETDYSDGLAQLWGSDRQIVNVEHDMQVSDELILRLLACKYPFCTWAYMLHHAGNHYAHREGYHPNAGGRWIDKGEEWAEFSGIGFCKIRPEVRVKPLEQTEWQVVDGAVRKATTGRVHVHWPEVQHYHPIGQ